MKVFVQFQDPSCLPEFGDLVKAMWAEGVSVSRAGNGSVFRDCTSLALCWDKWVDDPRWSSHEKFIEHVYFDISPDTSIIAIEVDDDATVVDRRAVHKACLLIAERCGGLLSVDEKKWISSQDYQIMHQSDLSCSFSEAVETALQHLSGPPEG